MDLSLLRVKQIGSHVSWILDQKFYKIMFTITSFIVRASVPAVLCAVLHTIQVCLVCTEGRECLTLSLCVLIDLEGY